LLHLFFKKRSSSATAAWRRPTVSRESSQSEFTEASKKFARRQGKDFQQENFYIIMKTAAVQATDYVFHQSRIATLDRYLEILLYRIVGDKEAGHSFFC
jgi:hypothetical protein